MTRDELRAEILKAATFHGDEGTSGYLLSGDQVDAIMEAADRYAVQAGCATRALLDIAEQQRKLSAERLERVRTLALGWAHGAARPPASLAACGVAVLDIVAPHRSRIGDAVCKCPEGGGCSHRKPESARKPSPGKLRNQAGGDRAEYRRLLREHGHILAPGDEGYGPDAPRMLPCGWSPDKAKPGGGR